jgi:hypothetical protein
LPKRPEKRLDQTHKREQTTDIPPVGKAKRPSLPRGCSAQTRRWWKTWVESPQAQLFEATDWQRLLDLVALKEAFYAGKLGLMPEIRRNEAELGATYGDRLRLRLRVGTAKEEEERLEKAARRAAALEAGGSAGAKGSRRADPRLKLVKEGQ